MTFHLRLEKSAHYRGTRCILKNEIVFLQIQDDACKLLSQGPNVLEMPILSILSLLLVGLATADPICSHIFGRPSYNDCEELATELTYGWPSDIYKGVKRLNLFSLPGAEIPSWVGRRSRYHHVNLPRFAGHSESDHT